MMCSLQTDRRRTERQMDWPVTSRVFWYLYRLSGTHSVSVHISVCAGRVGRVVVTGAGGGRAYDLTVC